MSGRNEYTAYCSVEDKAIQRIEIPENPGVILSSEMVRNAEEYPPSVQQKQLCLYSGSCFVVEGRDEKPALSASEGSPALGTTERAASPQEVQPLLCCGEAGGRSQP